MTMRGALGVVAVCAGGVATANPLPINVTATYDSVIDLATLDGATQLPASTFGVQDQLVAAKIPAQGSDYVLNYGLMVFAQGDAAVPSGASVEVRVYFDLPWNAGGAAHSAFSLYFNPEATGFFTAAGREVMCASLDFTPFTVPAGQDAWVCWIVHEPVLSSQAFYDTIETGTAGTGLPAGVAWNITSGAQITLNTWPSQHGGVVGAAWGERAACSAADVTTQGAGIGDAGYGIPDGLVTAADLNYFVNLWLAGDAGADVTSQGAGVGDPGYGIPDGSVTASDLNYFVNRWINGCP